MVEQKNNNNYSNNDSDNCYSDFSNTCLTEYDYDDDSDSDSNHYDYDYDYLKCISCKRDYYQLTTDGRCERCWRSICTILEIKSPLNNNLMDNVFYFLNIKINHEKRVHEQKSKHGMLAF